MPEVPSTPIPSDEPGDTARIDRRHTILAQIEAALLADKLDIEQAGLQRTGSDPYNSGTYKGIAGSGVWSTKRPR